MLAGPEIVRPSLSEDRPALARLAAVALVCLVVGLALSNASAPRNRWLPRVRTALGHRVAVATLAREDAPRSTAATPAPSASPLPTRTEEPEAPSLPAALSSALSEVVAEPSNALGAIAGQAAVAPAERRSGGRHRVAVQPGRVAYLRCDGAPEQEGLFPCPRDRALEERAFGAILGLATCRDLAAASPAPVGRADAWLIFHGAELGGIRMRESPGGEAVSEAIRLCLESRLVGLRSRAPSDRMTVSFRFELR